MNFHIAPESVVRFRKDDRIWTIEVWFRIETAKGETSLQVWEMYPDPCCPHMGNQYTEREWRLRKLTLNELGRLNFAECPAGLAENITAQDQETNFIVNIIEFGQPNTTEF